MKTLALLFAIGSAYGATVTYSFQDTNNLVAPVAGLSSYNFAGESGTTTDLVLLPNLQTTFEAGLLTVTPDPNQPHTPFFAIFPVAYTLDSVFHQSSMILNLAYNGGWSYTGELFIPNTQAAPFRTYGDIPFGTSESGVANGTPNPVTVQVTDHVPEPGTFGLAALTGLALLAFHRRSIR